MQPRKRIVSALTTGQAFLTTDMMQYFRTSHVASLVGAKKVNLSAVLIWLLGVATYHLCAKFAPEWGAALPTLALTFVLARVTRAPSTPVSGQASLSSAA